VTEVDLGSAGSDFGTVGGIAVVARGGELAVEPATHARQPLQHFANAVQARFFDLAFVDERDGRILVERIMTDAGSGDDDLIAGRLADSAGSAGGACRVATSGGARCSPLCRGRIASGEQRGKSPETGEEPYRSASSIPDARSAPPNAWIAKR
jgi:hypothetical protein